MLKLSTLVTPRILLGMLLLVGILGGQGGRGTLAYFTSTVTSNANTFTAGTLILQGDGAATDNAKFVAGNTTWKPGQFVVAPITIKNNGTLPLTYGLSYTDVDSGSLTTFMTYAIKTTGTGTGASATCDTDTHFQDGTIWQSSVLGSTALSTSGATPLANTARSLAAGASEVLCFEFAFTNGAAGAENGAQGDAATFTLSFNARQ